MIKRLSLAVAATAAAGVIFASVGSVALAGANTALPLTGSFGNEVVTLTPTPNPFRFTYSVSGATGYATVVGNFAIALDEGTITFNHTYTSYTLSGHYTWQTANGDLYGTYTGYSTGPNTFQNSGPIVGGTGRYAGATGQVTFDHVDQQTGPLTIASSGTFTGMISLG